MKTIVEVEHPEDIARREAIRERQWKEKEMGRRVAAANRAREEKLRAEVASGGASVYTPTPLRR